MIGLLLMVLQDLALISTTGEAMTTFWILLLSYLTIVIYRSIPDIIIVTMNYDVIVYTSDQITCKTPFIIGNHRAY